MVVVVIVSMGLLITVLAVGVVRLRSVSGRDQVEDAEVEMAWEGAPNITINPLEVICLIVLCFGSTQIKPMNARLEQKVAITQNIRRPYEQCQIYVNYIVTHFCYHSGMFLNLLAGLCPE